MPGWALPVEGVGKVDVGGWEGPIWEGQQVSERV